MKTDWMWSVLNLVTGPDKIKLKAPPKSLEDRALGGGGGNAAGYSKAKLGPSNSPNSAGSSARGSPKSLRSMVFGVHFNRDLPENLNPLMERLLNTMLEGRSTAFKDKVFSVAAMIAASATVIAGVSAFLSAATLAYTWYSTLDDIKDTVTNAISDSWNWVKEKVTGKAAGTPAQVDSLVTDSKASPADTDKTAKVTGTAQEMIVKTAIAQGVDPAFALAAAHKESAGTFDHKIAAKKGSAKGIFQFTDSSWGEYVKKYGKKFNIKVSDRDDPRAQVILGVLMLKESSAVAKEYGLLGHQAKYAYHVLGPSGSRFLFDALKNSPNAIAADLYRKADKGGVVKNNPGLFYDHNVNGRVQYDKPRTIRQLYEIGFNLDKMDHYSVAVGNMPGVAGVTTASSTVEATQARSKETIAGVGSGIDQNQSRPSSNSAITVPAAAATTGVGSKGQPGATTTQTQTQSRMAAVTVGVPASSAPASRASVQQPQTQLSVAASNSDTAPAKNPGMLSEYAMDVPGSTGGSGSEGSGTSDSQGKQGVNNKPKPSKNIMASREEQTENAPTISSGSYSPTIWRNRHGNLMTG